MIVSAQVLIAGIGNMFYCDDGFGPAVIRRLTEDRLPDGMQAADYGIRGVHLAYDLLDAGCRSLVLVDAMPMGERPGTLAVVEVSDINRFDAVGGGIDAHSVGPATVLSALSALQDDLPRVLMVGCEPGDLECGIGLSRPVARAVDEAARLAFDTAQQELAGTMVA